MGPTQYATNITIRTRLPTAFADSADLNGAKHGRNARDEVSADNRHER
jgi:hypothetical protein